MKKMILIYLIFQFNQTFSYGQILNGGFESSTANWQSIGDASTSTGCLGPVATSPIITPSFGPNIYPQEGSVMVQLVTGGTASISDIELFAGVAVNKIEDLDTVTSTFGAAVKQTFNANAGDILNFNVNFSTDEDPQFWVNSEFGDYSFFCISGGGIDTCFFMIDTDSLYISQQFMGTSADCDSHHSVNLWNVGSYTFPSSGTFSVSVGVLNCGDNTGISNLLLDNVTLTSPSGINSENDNSFFTVYPNPAEDMITIEGYGAINSLTISDMEGRCVIKEKTKPSKYILDVSGFSNGIYFAEIISVNGNKTTKKFIVNK